MARGVVSHGGVLVNGKKVDIPSYRVSENDIVEVAPKFHGLTPFIVARGRGRHERTPPAWIEVIPDKMRILVHTLPVRAQDRHSGSGAAHRPSTTRSRRA